MRNLFCVLVGCWLICLSDSAFRIPRSAFGQRLALPGYRYEFPRDHFSHLEFKTEWWYYTGNLAARDGREFGFELTFFRERIPNEHPNPSRWRIGHLYLAHLALTDIGPGAFYYAQKMHRGALGIAGALAPGVVVPRVWVEDWSAEIGPQSHRLRGTAKDFAIDLELRPAKPPVIHGRDGISRKGAGEGRASHYYSLSRLQGAGTVRVAGRAYTVDGLAWMDHEFSSSQLSPGQVGWDWFGLQLDDGSELMLFQLRREDGSADPFSAGTFVPAEGAAQHLEAANFRLEPLRAQTWTSPRSGARYPVAWLVRVPARQLELEVRSAAPGQELLTAETTGVSYWEGAVRVAGKKEGRPVSGRGYLEMTGYAAGDRTRLLK